MKEKKEGRLRVRNSRKLYLPFYVMVAILIVMVIYIKFSGRPLHNIAFKSALLFFALVIIATEIHRLGNSYELTNDSIIHKKGYFTFTSKRIEFGAISDCDVRQTLWQRLFSYGNVEVHRFSEITIIKNINNPSLFLDFLGEKMNINERKRNTIRSVR